MTSLGGRGGEGIENGYKEENPSGKRVLSEMGGFTGEKAILLQKRS